MKVFPGWNTQQFAGNVARIGLNTWLRLRLINSLLIFIPLIAFAYSVIYFLLPNYFFDKKNRVPAAVIFIGMFVSILLLQYTGSWFVARNWISANPSVRKLPPVGLRINENIGIILFNYPIIAGFAVIIKMMKRSWLKQQETLLITREKANAELQLLKAQIHPHFLFNTLNNVYFFTLTASHKAPEILVKLTDMLRYIMNDCRQPFVLLENEIKMISDYVELEKIRYGDRLKIEMEIKGNYAQKMIAPLLLIPLVENSFKHGASKMLEQPWVSLNITVDGPYLFFLLSNSRPQETNHSQQKKHIGLNNVKKRLELLYPATHELKIAETADTFEIFFKILLEDISFINKDVTVERTVYAMA